MRWTQWMWPPSRPGENRGWPNYIFGGRMRTSTAALILAFVALFWVNQTFQPAPTAAPQDQTRQVVPPGFVPDPNYTWVPRTNVQTRAPEYTTTTPTTTTPTTTMPTTTTPPPTTASTSPDATTPSSTDGTPPPGFPSTTVIDPDGPGPLSPETFTQAPPMLAPTTVAPPGPAPATTVPPSR